MKNSFFLWNNNMNIKTPLTQEEIQAFYKERKTGNRLIFIGVASLIVGIYYYTIKRISQNDFKEYENEKLIGKKK